MKDRAKAGMLLGIAIGILISLYIMPSTHIMNLTGRIIGALGCLIWSIICLMHTKQDEGN